MSTPNRIKLIKALGDAGIMDFNTDDELQRAHALFKIMTPVKPVRKRRKKSEQTLFES